MLHLRCVSLDHLAGDYITLKPNSAFIAVIFLVNTGPLAALPVLAVVSTIRRGTMVLQVFREIFQHILGASVRLKGILDLILSAAA